MQEERVEEDKYAKRRRLRKRIWRVKSGSENSFRSFVERNDEEERERDAERERKRVVPFPASNFWEKVEKAINIVQTANGEIFLV